jgi:hypothetical protein
MPFIRANVSTPVSNEKELAIKSGLGKTIQLIPGKTESGLMVEIVENCTLYLAGNQDNKTAYVKVELRGDLDDEASNNVTHSICELLEKELCIPQNRVYVTYECIRQWGCNGKNL